MRSALLLLIAACASAVEVDWHRSALHGTTPDNEVLRLTIGSGSTPNILERWWNGHRARWLDEPEKRS